MKKNSDLLFADTICQIKKKIPNAQIEVLIPDFKGDVIALYFLTLGQYLQPPKEHLPVDRYVTPDEFNHWADVAKKLGFTRVASGPLVRSSYHAKELFLE
jgi:lipoate synthase